MSEISGDDNNEDNKISDAVPKVSNEIKQLTKSCNALQESEYNPSHTKFLLMGRSLL